MGAAQANPDQHAEGHQDLDPLLATKQKVGTKVKEMQISVALNDTESIGFAYNAGCRPYRDTIFTYLFIGSVLFTYGIGIFAVRNADFNGSSELRFSRYNPNSGHCETIEHVYVGNTPTHVSVLHGRRAYEKNVNHAALAEIIIPVLGTLVLTVPWGMLMLWLLHRFTRQIVLVTFPLFFLVGLATLFIWSTICMATECSRTVDRAYLIVYFIWGLVLIPRCIPNSYWSDVDFTVKLLKTALEALNQNFSLLLLNPILWLVTVIVTCPILTFIVFAQFNGQISPDFDMINDPNKGCSQATGSPCCTFKPAGWVSPYVIFAWFCCLWVTLVTGQLQILVISGTISQWYFAPAGSSTFGTTKRSLRNAFGPSFGTACFSGLTSPILELLNGVTSRARNGSRQSVISVLLQACFSCMFQILDCYTRFMSNFAAITGGSFCTSARSTSELLRRNFLSTIFVEVLAHRVLAGFKVLFAVPLFLIFYGVLEFLRPGKYWNYVTTSLCFAVGLLGLVHFSLVTSAAIDTVYICYAMDKDVGTVSKQEIHDLYMSLPPTSSDDETIFAVHSEPEQQILNN